MMRPAQVITRVCLDSKNCEGKLRMVDSRATGQEMLFDLRKEVARFMSDNRGNNVDYNRTPSHLKVKAIDNNCNSNL